MTRRMVRIEEELIEACRKKYPETKGLSNTGVIDVVLRTILKGD